MIFENQLLANQFINQTTTKQNRNRNRCWSWSWNYYEWDENKF